LIVLNSRRTPRQPNAQPFDGTAPRPSLLPVCPGMPLSEEPFEIEKLVFHNKRDSVPESVAKRQRRFVLIHNISSRFEGFVAILMDFIQSTPGFISYIPITFHTKEST
jgi:hypothetical protein